VTFPALLVLAAGMGTRYGGLKQIDPVGPSRETIVDYSVYDALRDGFEKLVLVIRRGEAAQESHQGTISRSEEESRMAAGCHCVG
jgi:CTP:molybdopterin cytidylyltransferase MocA